MSVESLRLHMFTLRDAYMGYEALSEEDRYTVCKLLFGNKVDHCFALDNGKLRPVTNEEFDKDLKSYYDTRFRLALQYAWGEARFQLAIKEDAQKTKGE